ncbi:hypothetical protein L596_027230 [Steinernema carpocapsae]|uniref:Uncharacterized protein n=1 Tax=Steinernema carpocapsae TaxID=34508 RepID=A0A4U5M3P1_STECR|nr:hypothetical protein L596_027230 [Steinernema carpocapsae]
MSQENVDLGYLILLLGKAKLNAPAHQPSVMTFTNVCRRSDSRNTSLYCIYSPLTFHVLCGATCLLTSALKRVVYQKRTKHSSFVCNP